MEVELSEAISVHDQSDARGGLVLDALPYIDTVQEDYEQYALSMIEDEMKKIKPPKVKSLPQLNFKSDLLKNDFKILSQKDSNRVLKLNSRAEEPSENTTEAWKKAVADARAEYETERQRSVVLEIEKSEASTQQWKLYMGLLDSLQQQTKQQVEQGSNTVDQINARRQEHQEKVGQSLHVLTTQYQSKIQKRFQLQVALRDLEAEVDALRKCSN
mmetsp:Transcript_20042/g.29724  ORF Transcript_20042/g.29724 Transcript_20042/m.29724 type:complete len:215 (+) Transcript_20042:130-774(+)